MKADLIQYVGSDLVVVNAARVSMNKQSTWDWENNETDENGELLELQLKKKDAQLISYLAKHRHYTPFEHCFVTLRLKVPLFIRSQIQRHRTFSYNEISRRYVKDELEFYWPEKWRKAAENVKQGSSDEEWTPTFDFRGFDPAFGLHGKEKVLWANELKDSVNVLVKFYEQSIADGLCAEQARMILPQNLYTQFYMSGNLRNWTHFLKLRLDSHAQKEVRDIAQQCADIIEPLFPVSYKELMGSE